MCALGSAFRLCVYGHTVAKVDNHRWTQKEEEEEEDEEERVLSQTTERASLQKTAGGEVMHMHTSVRSNKHQP